MSIKYWLLLEKSDDTRISKGIDGCKDETGESYHFDSLVPNYKRINSGDYCVLRKENTIFGVGKIGTISEKGGTKTHRRCPQCRSTDIRERKTKAPKWKCGKCAIEFSSPDETIVEVHSFLAPIEYFTKLDSPPSVQAVKRCAKNGDGIRSQLSMLELHADKIQTLLEGAAPSSLSRSKSRELGGQGFGLSAPERKAVEMRAMRIARGLYESEGWEVIDKSNSQPFDLLATRDGSFRFIEVKGTTGAGRTILLTTHGEVNHVQQNKPCSALVIVSNICLKESGGEWVASGGDVTTREDPWNIEEFSLEAVEYRYSIQTRSG